MISGQILLPDDLEKPALTLEWQKRKLSKADFDMAMTQSHIPQKTTEFHLEQDAISSVQSYNLKNSSNHYLECIEVCCREQANKNYLNVSLHLNPFVGFPYKKVLERIKMNCTSLWSPVPKRILGPNG